MSIGTFESISRNMLMVDYLHLPSNHIGPFVPSGPSAIGRSASHIANWSSDAPSKFCWIAFHIETLLAYPGIVFFLPCAKVTSALS
jgi:hypothetical protein